MAENVTQRKVPYFALNVQKAFDALTNQEKLYAHHMACASWNGIMACAKQLSVESPLLLQAFFVGVDDRRALRMLSTLLGTSGRPVALSS